MTTKGPSKKQIIIYMGSNNIVNINRLLKGFKLEVSINFICLDNKGLLLTTNKVAASSDLNIIKKYLKELNDVCCGNHLSQRQIITQTVNLLVRYQVENLQENSTRSLCLISVLFIQMCPGPWYHYLNLPYSPCFILMSASLLTQGHHVYSRYPDIIF